MEVNDEDRSSYDCLTAETGMRSHGGALNYQHGASPSSGPDVGTNQPMTSEVKEGVKRSVSGGPSRFAPAIRLDSNNNNNSSVGGGSEAKAELLAMHYSLPGTDLPGVGTCIMTPTNESLSAARLQNNASNLVPDPSILSPRSRDTA